LDVTAPLDDRHQRLERGTHASLGRKVPDNVIWSVWLWRCTWARMSWPPEAKSVVFGSSSFSKNYLLSRNSHQSQQ